MKPSGENAKFTGKTNELHPVPRLQDVMSIAQREQANAFTRFLKSWPRVKRPHGQETPPTSIAFGAQ